ncbi:MAG: hypothetical protein QXD13_00390 [Candidatus Pacearchaeota archaeon]
MEINELIAKIRQKKELSSIPSQIVQELLEEYLKKNNIFLKNLKKSEIKSLIKSIRARLRESIGGFQRKWKNRFELLEKNDIKSLLETHSSTKERIGFYPGLKKLIYDLNITSILDIGCGLNPIALASPKIKYYASDIDLEELLLIKSFFEKNKIDGKTFFCDLKKIELCNLPKADICLILKVFDAIEKKGHKLAEKIIKFISAKYFLISFSTKTLSGKPMAHPQRGWIERLLNRLGFTFKIIKSKNEIYYLASKSEQIA